MQAVIYSKKAERDENRQGGYWQSDENDQFAIWTKLEYASKYDLESIANKTAAEITGEPDAIWTFHLNKEEHAEMAKEANLRFQVDLRETLTNLVAKHQEDFTVLGLSVADIASSIGSVVASQYADMMNYNENENLTRNHQDHLMSYLGYMVGSYTEKAELLATVESRQGLVDNHNRVTDQLVNEHDVSYPEGFNETCGISPESMREANRIATDLIGKREWDVTRIASSLDEIKNRVGYDWPPILPTVFPGLWNLNEVKPSEDTENT